MISVEEHDFEFLSLEWKLKGFFERFFFDKKVACRFEIFQVCGACL